ncbi:inovirus Gp2 family protein [Serratia fonticola]|uniref:inovirus Gp2 family protein n=1 Tax=Serratia fonticola TaxID=47917 RepID=UPI00217B0D4A|nr:inovirus Gp2 family protein [Serratia fonticola]CAI0887319.1 Protein of uncharacterised function (DUF3296) [Serratia fonticola]
MRINTNNYGPFNSQSIKRIKETLGKALQEYPRTLVLRVDLRLSDCDYSLYGDDSTLITRFIVSLKAQISADLERKHKAGKRTHHCRLRYIWAREFCEANKKHYHLVLLFNKDTYAYPGAYFKKEDGYKHNLSLMIMEAWARTLNKGLSDNSESFYPLVEFPCNGYYHLNVNSERFDSDFRTVIYRANYLAKIYSKDYTDGQRCFGCSQF